MKIYTKILLSTLPIILLAVFASGGWAYLFNRTMLSQAAEKWLECKLPDAVYRVGAQSTSGAELPQAQAQAVAEINDLKVGNQGYAFAVNSRGIVTAYPDPNFVGADVSASSWFQQLKAAPQGKVSYQWPDQQYLALYQYYQPWDWYILVTDPYSEVYAPVGKVGAFTLVTGLGVVGIMAVALAYVTRRLTSPLSMLQLGSEEVGHGNLAVRIPVKTNDEIGRLGRVFNQMASQLQESLQALQKSEKYYRSLIEHTSDVILIINRQGVVNYTSPAVRRITGFLPENFLGKSIFDFIHPEDNERAKAALEDLAQHIRVPFSELRARTKAGGWVDLDCTGNNLLDEPTVNGLVIYARPIADLKRSQQIQSSIYRIAEAAAVTHNLDELFAEMHTVISDLMPAQNFYIALHDPARGLLDFAYFVDEYEAKPDPQPVGRGLTEYVLRIGEPLLASPEKFAQMVASGEVEEIGPPSIDWLGVPLKTGERVVGVMVVQSYTENVRFSEADRDILAFVSDQTAMAIARKQAEEAQRENENRYRELFENSPISLWEEDFSQVVAYLDTLKSNGIRDFNYYFETHPEAVGECMNRIRILDINQATLRLYGATSKEQPISRMSDDVKPGILPLLIDELAAIAENRWEFEGNGVGHKMDGTPIHIVVRWLARPKIDLNNSVITQTSPGKTTSPAEDNLPANGKPESAPSTERYLIPDYSRLIVSMLDITGRMRAEEQVQRQVRHLHALRAIDVSITGSMDLQSTLNVLLDQVTTQLSVDAASVLLLDPHILMLHYGASQGFHTSALQHTQLRLGEGYAGKAAFERKLVHIPDLKASPGELKVSPMLADEGFVTYFASPLIAKGVVKGVLEIFHRSLLNPSVEWLEFLEMLGRQAAIAIDNASLFADLQHSNTELTLAYDATIEGWSRALDLRDHETEGHTRRVSEMTQRLAERMGLSAEARKYLRWGALLHDIGKMAISDNILLKKSPLTREERQAMRRHPVYAYEMLLPISYLRQALDIPHFHHERWNGAGYPSRLKSEQIPLAARLFAVVDVWDALRSDRPYRKAWGEARSLGYIQTNAGRHFDPLVVEAFLKMKDEG